MSQLCQLSDVKEYLGVGDATTDTVLTDLIARASTQIETYCNRIFAQASYTETRNGGCGPKMFLLNGPVISVTSLSVDGQAVPAAASAVSYGFVNDDTTVYIRPASGGAGGGPMEFRKGLQNVTIVYTAGYVTTPPDVVQACIELVAYKFAKRKRIDKSSETLGQQQTQAYSMADMPSSVKSALQPYVRWNGQ